MTYEEQGRGPVVPGQGYRLVSIMEGRGTSWTLLRLDDGPELLVRNGHGSRDMGKEWEDLYVDAEPTTLGQRQLYFLDTAEIVEAVDPTDGVTLYRRTEA